MTYKYYYIIISSILIILTGCKDSNEIKLESIIDEFEYLKNNNLIEEIAVDGGVAEVNEKNITILCERAETINVANKQIIEEKIKTCEKQINDNDDAISSSAKKESEFLTFVLNKIN